MASENPIVVCSIDKSRQSEEAFECKYPKYAVVFIMNLKRSVADLYSDSSIVWTPPLHLLGLMVCSHCPTPTPLPTPIGSIVICRSVHTEPSPTPVGSIVICRSVHTEPSLIPTLLPTQTTILHFIGVGAGLI